MKIIINRKKTKKSTLKERKDKETQEVDPLDRDFADTLARYQDPWPNTRELVQAKEKRGPERGSDDYYLLNYGTEDQKRKIRDKYGLKDPVPAAERAFLNKRENTKKQQAVNMLLYRIKQGYNKSGYQLADAEKAFAKLNYMKNSGDRMAIEAYKELSRQREAGIMEEQEKLADFVSGVRRSGPAAGDGPGKKGKRPFRPAPSSIITYKHQKSDALSAAEKAWDEQKAKQDAEDARKQYDSFMDKLAKPYVEDPDEPDEYGSEDPEKYDKEGRKKTQLPDLGRIGTEEKAKAAATSKPRLADARKEWKEARSAMGPNWKSLDLNDPRRVRARTAYKKLQAAKKGRPSRRSKPEASTPSDRFDKRRRRSSAAFPRGGSGDLPAGDYSVASEKGKAARQALDHPAVKGNAELTKLIASLLD